MLHILFVILPLERSLAITHPMLITVRYKERMLQCLRMSVNCLIDIAKSQFAIMNSRPHTPVHQDFGTPLLIDHVFIALLTVICNSYYGYVLHNTSQSDVDYSCRFNQRTACNSEWPQDTATPEDTSTPRRCR